MGAGARPSGESQMNKSPWDSNAMTMKPVYISLLAVCLPFAFGACQKEQSDTAARTRSEITTDLIDQANSAKATLDRFSQGTIAADETERRLARGRDACDPLWKELTQWAARKMEDSPDEYRKIAEDFQSGKFEGSALGKEFAAAKSSLMMRAVRLNLEKKLTPKMKASLASILQLPLDSP